jgi:MSHA pilin protein MshC
VQVTARGPAHGFTLIELVLVLVLVSILAVFVAPRFGSVTSFTAQALQDKLRAEVRYAQSVAMSRNRRGRIYFNGAGSAPAAGYAAVIDTSGAGDCSSFIAINDPAGDGALVVALNAGSYTGLTVVPARACLEFDSLGRPYDCSAAPGSCSTLPAGLTIDVNGNPSMRILITSQTGAVN